MQAEHSTEEQSAIPDLQARKPKSPLRSRKWFWFAVAALTVLVVTGGIFGWNFAARQRADQVHFERDETHLIVTNLLDGVVHLYKAGDRLEDATELPYPGDRIWLEPGSYFLKVEQAGSTSYYPVPITGYRAGPDEDGALIVTVRAPPPAEPRLLVPWSLPFAFIPSGQFLLGERLNKQDPHYVWLTGYFIGRFEVTNAEFREFLNDPTGYNEPSNWTEEGKRWKTSSAPQATALLKPPDEDYARFGQDDQPVVKVSWYEANAYCHWLTRKLGGKKWIFGLPNEAEWEKAARGPDGLYYGLSNTLSDDEVKLYNWKKNPSAEVTVIGQRDTQAGYKPNRYGLYHMSGNVTEWTQSVERAYNRQHPFVDDDRNHDDVKGSRVMRGGSWYTASVAVLSLSYREFFQPSVSAPYLGFRVVARPLP